MAEMSDHIVDKLSQAIVLWTGWGRTPIPCQDQGAVIDHYGLEEGTRLLERVRALEDTVYASDAKSRANDLLEMAKMASDDFRKRHPEVGEEAIRAFAWSYTFDYK